MNTSRFSEKFAHLSSGDIAVFQHTPNLQELNAFNCRGINGKKVAERSLNTSRVSEKFAQLSSGDIAVFQHTPNLKVVGVERTAVTGKKFAETS